MNAEKMFEKASRMRLRFSYKGLIATEDLWFLSLEDLDQIYKNLKKKEKDSAGESLLETKTKNDEILELQIELIKYVVAEKQSEASEKELAMAKRTEAKRIETIIAARKEQAMEALTDEELLKRLEELKK